MKLLVDETLTAWQALGGVSYGPTDKEKASSIFRRSIYIVEDIKEDEKLTRKNIRIIRPGDGLYPRYFDILLGKKVSCHVKRGTPMSWEFVK